MPKQQKQKAKAQLHRRVRTRASHHYHRVMPNKKRHRIMIWVAFFSYAIIAAAQLLYPLDRALPLAKFDSLAVGWQSRDQLAGTIAMQFQSTDIHLKTPQKAYTTSLSSTGAEINTESMLNAVSEYPFWWRFVPLSILWQPVQVEYLDVSYTPSVLEKFSDAQAKHLTIAPKSARLSITKGELVAESDISGQSVASQVIADAIAGKKIRFTKSVEIPLPTTRTKASVRSSDFIEVREQAEGALARGITLYLEGAGELSVKSSEVASWLLIGEDKDKQPKLTFDKKAFNRYLDTIDKKFGEKPGVTNITIVNGVETARQTGKPGKAIDRTSLATVAKDWVLTGVGMGYIPAVFTDVPPTITYNSKYTATEAGLRAYVRDKSREMNVAIAIRQMSGEKWTASARANVSMPSASTYKLYVAKWLFDQMDEGKVRWGDSILGTTVSDCFDRMTIASTNPCAQEWLRQAGRSNFNNYLYKLGFSRRTSFTMPDATHSTANDLLRFMTMLHEGSITSDKHRERLLHSLSVHPYRYGVPTGSKGRVWDKVGFLWDYVHDAAIIKHPKGTYVMVVMTKGQSYARIAEITREVEKIMYP